MTERSLPTVAITMGDPAGVGAEVIAGALAYPSVHEVCRPLVIGDRRVMEAGIRAMRTGAALVGPDAPASPAAIPLLDLTNASPDKIRPGQVSAAAGQAAWEYIQASVRLAREGKAQAVVTDGRDHPGRGLEDCAFQYADTAGRAVVGPGRALRGRPGRRCGHPAAVRHITWPALGQVRVVAVLLTTLHSFREFGQIYVISGGGPARATETLSVQLYVEAFELFHFGYASAIGVVMLGISLLFTYATLRLSRTEFY